MEMHRKLLLRLTVPRSAAAHFFYIIAVTIPLTLFSAVIFAQAVHIQLTPIRGNVFLVQDEYPLSEENSAVYIGENFVTIVGATWTPGTAAKLMQEVAKITDKPVREVIDTNYNLDRAGGNPYFKQHGIRVVSLQLTAELIRRNWAEMVKDARRRQADYPDSPPALPDVTYPGSFDLQGGRVKAIYLGPSHAPDDVFVYFPQEKILYGGCILKEELGNLQFADLQQYPRTLRKLQQLNLGYTTVIAGHDSPIHGPELVEHYLHLLDQHQQRAASIALN